MDGIHPWLLEQAGTQERGTYSFPQAKTSPFVDPGMIQPDWFVWTDGVSYDGCCTFLQAGREGGGATIKHQSCPHALHMRLSHLLERCTSSMLSSCIASAPTEVLHGPVCMDVLLAWEKILPIRNVRTTPSSPSPSGQPPGRPASLPFRSVFERELDPVGSRFERGIPGRRGTDGRRTGVRGKGIAHTQAGSMATSSGEKPDLNRLQTKLDGEAVFRDAETEIPRILAFQKNYYAILKVTKDSDPNQIKKNYYKLSRIVHPDKCKVEHAEEAFKVVGIGYDTLTNPAKKALYNRYASNVDFNAENADTYADWEAKQATMPPVKIPKWLETILRIRGVGFVCAILLVIIFVPLLLIFLIIMLIIAIPTRCLAGCLCPEKLAEADAKAREDFERAKQQQGGTSDNV